MSKKYPKFLMIFVFLVISKNRKNTSIFRQYFNSSYYSFLTFLTLYQIFFNISQKKFSSQTQWGGLIPLAYASRYFSKALFASIQLLFEATSQIFISRTSRLLNRNYLQ